MNKHFLLLIALFLGITSLNANPVDREKARIIGQKFACTAINSDLKASDLQLVYIGTSNRGEACFYAFNVGEEGFVIVSADDRFRPIVGYSNEGPFETENMSPELAFYLEKIIEARTSRNAVLFDNTAEEWASVANTGKLISRNGGRGVDFICTTKWNQDSPYNLYAPDAPGGPGDRCYAGCVATAMSQVMKRWNHPLQGTGSHSYYCHGHGTLSANFGNTTYDWDNMPDRLGGASQEEIEAVALLMYHCAVAVDMDFSPSGSGANSWDVPYAIRHYFSYSNQCSLKSRDEYSIFAWQDMLKEQFDLGWPVYYSGFSNSGGHAFVCDGYDDDDLFHFNWGWGGSSDGWFVIDEIDYAGWAQAIFNYVPTDVYSYMPLQPENMSVEPSNDFDYAATISWINPTQNIHLENLTAIDQIVLTRNGEVIYTEDNVTPGATMSFTDHYMPTIVDYCVYAVVHNAQGKPSYQKNVLLGPTCNWSVEMTSSDPQGWHEGKLTFVNGAGDEVACVTLESSSATQTITLPLGHIDILWNKPVQPINVSFKVKNSNGERKVSFQGLSSDVDNGLFYIANNTCSNKDEESNGPVGLTATPSGDDITLNWTMEGNQNIIHYYVFRDNILIAVSESTQFTDPQAANDFHTYFVTACSNDGETLHSNVANVMPESPCGIPTNLRYEMVTPTKVKVMWDAPEAEGVTGYILYRRIKGQEFKRIKALTNTYHTDNINAQEDNLFEYAVAAYYRDSDCTSGYATTQDNPEMHFIEINKTIIPRHLDFFIHQGHVVLQWDEATMAEKYYIYRDGQHIGWSESTDFVDFSAVQGQAYTYTVTGKTASVESNPTNSVYVDWTTGIDENGSEKNVRLYPNPTESQVTIEGQGLRQVRVFNVTGQEIEHRDLSGSQAVIDLSNAPKGCYFIEVTSESGCMTSKIMKL